MTAPVLEQVQFRGRDDSQTLNSATFSHALNANFTQAAGVVFRLRFTVAHTAGNKLTNGDFRLQFRIGAGAFANITTTSAVRAVTSTQYTQGDATSQVISSGSFVAGQGRETEPLTGTITLNSQRTEYEWALEIDDTQVANGAALQFRVVQGDGTVLDTYTQTPTVTAVVAVSGSLDATEEGADTAAFAGEVGEITGSLAASEEGADTADFEGEVSIPVEEPYAFSGPVGSFSIGALPIGGSEGADEEPLEDVTGSLAATEEGADTAAFTGTVEVSGGLAATEEGADTATFTGTVDISGSLTATEEGADTAAFTGTVEVSGSLAATEEGADTATFTGTVDVSGSLAATEEGADTAAFTGAVDISGSLTATEEGADTAAFTGTSGAEPVAPVTPTGGFGARGGGRDYLSERAIKRILKAASAAKDYGPRKWKREYEKHLAVAKDIEKGAGLAPEEVKDLVEPFILPDGQNRVAWEAILRNANVLDAMAQRLADISAKRRRDLEADEQEVLLILSRVL